ncbi:restriction modification system DNA specificity domain containing protein [Geobacillus sp. GHH01]|uniref:restriction endonuclease subunit S n=1 Tax=Geobacillus sp. GHH01 TaxID=1233873 RepID=UPI0002AF3910|nr:restriction endonuclease subunit S [Geobacillus sp. GHH01]AGE21846.1 restriction modification system DNA specificity domain containing protein [Geobacillus sp. GHH01]
MSEWKILKIDDIKANISNAIAMGPFGSRIKSDNFVDSGVPVIRGVNLKNGRFDESEFVFLTEEKAQELKSSLVYPDDIIFTHRGTLGQVGIIPKNGKYKKYIISQSQMKLTCNKEIVEPLYVYYYFKSPKGQYELLKNTNSTGVPAIASPSTTLRSLEIPIPDLKTQKRIISILSGLDDKIELNLKMNQTLEEMAMTLYKHWFVDFGPFQDGEFVESELGMIPGGWKVSSLKEFANILMGQSPKSEFYNRERKGLPFHQGVKDFGTRFPVHTVYCTQELRVANKGDILLSVRAPVGRINIANSKLVIGRGLSALNSKSGHNSFLLYTLKRIFAFEDQYGSGTVFNSISKKDIEQLKFIRPPQEVLDNFENHVSKFDALIEGNTKEIEELQELRDYLLPRLLSGEIDVSKAEKQVEEVL